MKNYNNIIKENDTEIPKYTTEWASSSDIISRQAAINAADRADYTGLAIEDVKKVTDEVVKELKRLPSAQPEIIRCKDCKHFAGEGMYCSCDIIVQFDHFYCYHAERRQDV